MAVGERLPHPHSMPAIGVLVLVQTLAVLAVCAWFGVRSANLALHGVAAQGTVVAFAKPTAKGYASAIVEFPTPTGQRFRFESMQSFFVSRPAIGIGAVLPVRYSTEDPSVSAIDSFSEMWKLPAIFLLFGVVGAIAAPILLVLGRRRTRARRHVKETGWHVPAVVVGASTIAVRGGGNYVPEVEIRDPQTGATVRCKGDRQHAKPTMGGTAVVHVAQTPPHGYFVEVP